MSKIKHTFSKEIILAIRPLMALNNWRGIMGVFEDYLVIGFAIYLSELSLWFYPLTLLFIGSRQRALASLFHEVAHLTFARSKLINAFIGRLFTGYPVMQGFDTYRKSHVYLHHTYLGDSEKDPDYINYIENGLYQIKDRYEFAFKHILKTITLLHVPRYVKYLFLNRFAKFSDYPVDVLGIIAVQAVMFTIFTLYIGPMAYLKYWLIPFFTTFQIIGWFSEIAEHYPLFEKGKSPLFITRNRFPGFLEGLFVGMHHDNYHLTHHLMAGIPFWNLEKAHRIMLQDPEYARANGSTGGIFLARKGKTPVIKEILSLILYKPLKVV